VGDSESYGAGLGGLDELFDGAELDFLRAEHDAFLGARLDVDIAAAAAGSMESGSGERGGWGASRRLRGGVVSGAPRSLSLRPSRRRAVIAHGDDGVGDVEVVAGAADDDMVEMSCTSASWRARSMNGVMGSCSSAMSACMRASRIMKFVADVSSSSSSTRAPTSIASTMAAACEVEPLAFVVTKKRVCRRRRGCGR
jgi:hypothetical protein